MPVFACLQFAVGPLDDARGSDFLSAAIDRALICYITEFEIFSECYVVDLVDEAGRAQRSYRRGESNLPVAAGVQKRLDAETVAHQEECTATIVPKGEGKHSASFVE